MTHLTRSTANRGVGVDEKDMTNASLDTTISTWQADSDADAEATACCKQPHRVASSMHVVVQKHSGKPEDGSMERPEQPAPAQCERAPCRHRAGDDVSWQASAQPVSVAERTPNHKLHLTSTAKLGKNVTCDGNYATRNGRFWARFPARRPPPRPRPAPVAALNPPQRHLEIDPDVTSAVMVTCAERIEVYYFECGGGGGYLATTDAAPATRTGNWVRRVEKLGVRLFAEMLAVPQLVATLPLAFLLQMQRSALICVRGLMVGSVQTCSDYLLKPALAVTFNAVLRPPLMFVGHAFASCRDALRPIAALLADYTEPAVRLVSAMALVRVHERCAACRIVRKRRQITPALQRI